MRHGRVLRALSAALVIGTGGAGPALAADTADMMRAATSPAPDARDAAPATDALSAQIAAASARLQEAADMLQAASGKADRVARIARTIRTYEEGQAALRETLRRIAAEETAVTARFRREYAQGAELMAVLWQMNENPAPLQLIHPAGPLGAIRAEMLVGDMGLAVQARAARLRDDLDELNRLRALADRAHGALRDGLGRTQEARAALARAISGRAPLPKRPAEDPATLAAIVADAETLDALATDLALTSPPGLGAIHPFVSAMGNLAPPALGPILRRPDLPDERGVVRPGVTLGTLPQALVTAPWPSTIRYAGPLLDYGNVVVLEPGDGYLMILGGLATIYGDIGDIMDEGAPVGLMGSADGGGADDANDGADHDNGREAGIRPLEPLYLELRHGATPIDPTAWFAGMARDEE